MLKIRRLPNLSAVNFMFCLWFLVQWLQILKNSINYDAEIVSSLRRTHLIDFYAQRQRPTLLRDLYMR